MNYETASDFDLSMAVAKLANPSNKDIQNWNGKVAIASGGDGRGGYWVTYFDINNPADMWPIMLEHGVSVINLKNTTQWIACVDAEFNNICMSPDGNDNGISAFYAKHECYHTNPLRAAAIVYLKMMEAK